MSYEISPPVPRKQEVQYPGPECGGMLGTGMPTLIACPAGHDWHAEDPYASEYFVKEHGVHPVEYELGA